MIVRWVFRPVVAAALYIEVGRTRSWSAAAKGVGGVSTWPPKGAVAMQFGVEAREDARKREEVDDIVVGRAG